jgi:hypothetical protein
MAVCGPTDVLIVGQRPQIFHTEYAMDKWFGIHDGLAATARVPSIARSGERIRTAELVALFLCGAAAAAATGFMRSGLRIPGNSIIFSVIPMALGLALAPRRMAGFIMSAGAFGTASAFSAAGLCHYGAGAFVSLCLTGPLMDVALARARSGWQLYTGLVASGIVANLLALASRGASKLLGLDVSGGMRPFAGWWQQAIVTYMLCGAVAGLIGALCCFHLRKRQQESRGRS